MADTPLLAEQVSAARAAVGRAAESRLAKISNIARLCDDRAAIYAIPEFLTPDECALLVDMIDATAVPSTLFDKDKQEYRTSNSGNLDRYDPVVEQVDRRICDLLGIAPAHGETIQGQRYQPGQYFKSHADFFYISEPYWPDMVKVGGQRTWTAMAYLNRPEAGGATMFDRLALEVLPEPGMLLLWNNMDAHGAPNEWTMHQGCPVEAGTKYIVTKWFREGEWFNLAKSEPPPQEATTSMTVTLRNASTSDASQLASLLSELGFPIAPEVVERNLAALTMPPIAADLDGRIIGLCALSTMQTLHRDAPVGRISTMVVTESARGRGLGTAMVREAERRLQANGCRLIEITSNEKLVDAHRFYRKLGYEQTSTRFAKALG